MKQILIIIAAIAAASSLRADNEKPSTEVWFFVATDCPIANYYAPEINRISDDYEDEGIKFSLIYPNTALTEGQVSDHRKEFGLKIEGRIDKGHRLVKKAGVTTTPEVAVFDKDGNLIYRGLIDDLYTEFGDRRQVASKRYLRDVLDLSLENGSLDFIETNPVGCLIEDIK